MLNEPLKFTRMCVGIYIMSKFIQSCKRHMGVPCRCYVDFIHESCIKAHYFLKFYVVLPTLLVMLSVHYHRNSAYLYLNPHPLFYRCTKLSSQLNTTAQGMRAEDTYMDKNNDHFNFKTCFN